MAKAASNVLPSPLTARKLGPLFNTMFVGPRRDFSPNGTSISSADLAHKSRVQRQTLTDQRCSDGDEIVDVTDITAHQLTVAAHDTS